MFQQAHEKDDLMKQLRIGIFIMDRSHLNLFAFFSKTQEEALRKAGRLHREFGDGENLILPAQIFFLQADRNAFEERLMRRRAGVRALDPFRYDADNLIEQQTSLSSTCKRTPDTTVDTSSLPPDDVARIISRKILLGGTMNFNLPLVFKSLWNSEAHCEPGSAEHLCSQSFIFHCRTRVE